jgi:hypothetical protein
MKTKSEYVHFGWWHPYDLTVNDRYGTCGYTIGDGTGGGFYGQTTSRTSFGSGHGKSDQYQEEIQDET